MSEAKLITCILPKGRGRRLQESLADDKGIHTADLHHARGIGRFTSLAQRGVGEQLEKEIIEVSVKAEDADDVFEYIFFEAEINKPHGGVMYMSPLQSASPFKLPDLEDQGSADEA